ncbi:MAG: sigma-54-dependent Fis family transcriptional regulator, partial [Rhodobacteraceae bacterium]|nr:sigma-54-dependent Fis family transcriptional regulator [Paracoccaceae bacterium]
AIAILQTMHSPGNVRQLKNVVERVLILGDGTGPIKGSEIPDVGNSEDENDEAESSGVSGALAMLPLREAREAFEREYLLTQINRFSGNISRTASFVGMERSALHRKLKSLGVVTTNKSGARVAHVTDEKQDEG